MRFSYPYKSRITGTQQFVPVALVFIAGMIAGCETVLRVLRVQGRLLPLLIGAAVAAALLFIAWKVAPIAARTQRVFSGFQDHAEAQIVTVCAYCRRTPCEDGKWKTVESWLLESFGLRISHGICPKCMDDCSSLNTRTSSPRKPHQHLGQ